MNLESENAKMEPEPKKRKTYRAPPRSNGTTTKQKSSLKRNESVSIASKIASSPTKKKDTVTISKKDTATTSMNSSKVHVAQNSAVYLGIQQAKNSAVAQARQDGCTGNFRIFDSPFGNYLLPVVPTRAELGG